MKIIYHQEYIYDNSINSLKSTTSFAPKHYFTQISREIIRELTNKATQ
jgi:hypothetical protein